MSALLSREGLRYEQRLLKCAGLYEGKIDGLWGKLTQRAEEAAAALYSQIADDYGGMLDKRSERNIKTLLPCGQRMARKVIMVAKQLRLDAKIISGTRTYAEQDALYAQGRSVEGTVVTNAKGGQSNHNFGVAVDVGLFAANGRYMTGANSGDEGAYRRLGQAVGQSHGQTIAWGGNWRSSKDYPHYEVAHGLSIAQLRGQFERGEFNGR